MMTEKNLPQPSSPQARSRLFTPYVMVWATMALLSVVYLGVLATQPTMVAGILGATPTTATSEDEDVAKTVAEVRSLRDTIDLFRNELIEIRAQLSSQTDTSRTIAARIEALETAPQQVAAEQPAKDKAKEKDAKKTAKAKEAEPAERTAMAEAADKKAKAKEKAAKKSLETGSVDQPQAPITFGPPTVTTTIPVPGPQSSADTGPVGVQIATGPSVDSLRLSWTLLNERHGDQLRALEPRYKTDASGAEPSYDLVVGPVADADSARRLCQELAVKATPCTVSRFTGSAL